MDEGVFVGWLKSDGQTVEAGEPLFNLEGDKATQEIESLETGIFAFRPTAPKTATKLRSAPSSATWSAPAKSPPSTPSERNPAAAPRLAGEVPPRRRWRGQAPAADAAHHRMSLRLPPTSRHPSHGNNPSRPRARRVARELGIDPTDHGQRKNRPYHRARHPRGRPRFSLPSSIAYPAIRPPQILSPSFETIAVSSIRKTIAERMVQSHQTTAPVTITTTIDATNLVNLRRQFKAVPETGDAPSIGYTEIVVKLTAMALAKHSMLNSRWNGNEIRSGAAFTSESPSTPRPD